MRVLPRDPSQAPSRSPSRALSRAPSRTRRALRQLVVVAALLLSAATSTARTGESAPLIERATPDPARSARSAAWLEALAGQRPALEVALRQLARQRERWRADRGTENCRRAREALARVDRGVLLVGQDYALVVSVGRAFDELEAAIRACSERRYFELGYRLDRSRRALARARATARRQVRP